MEGFVPLTVDMLVGYIPEENKYIVYSEYYGNGTIYGRREIINSDGNPISEKDKSVHQLIEMGAFVSIHVGGPFGGSLLQVHIDTQPKWVPLTPTMNVGFIEAENLYIVYSECYGDGTIYGRRQLQLPSGKAVRGKGKSIMNLISLGTLVNNQVAGATNGELIAVPLNNQTNYKSSRFPTSKRRKPRGPGVN